MYNPHFPTGPAESLRTREYAEVEWSQLVLNAPRDKATFLNSLKDINDRIIGLRQASSPPLKDSFQTTPTERQSGYSFVLDPNMRVASSSSLSNARGLRENLSKMLLQRPTAPQEVAQSNLQHDFDVLSSTERIKQKEWNGLNPSRNTNNTKNSFLAPVPMDNHPQSTVQNQETKYSYEESDGDGDARRDAEFARALESFRGKIVQKPQEEMSMSTVPESAVFRAEPPLTLASTPILEAESEDEEVDVEVEEDAGESERALDEVSRGTEDRRDSIPVGSPVRVATTAPSAPPLPPPIQVPQSQATPQATAPLLPKVAVRKEMPVEVEVESIPKLETTSNTASIDFDQDRLSRLQAWELQLQERERELNERRNHLSRPVGAKLPPRQQAYNDEEETEPHSAHLTGPERGRDNDRDHDRSRERDRRDERLSPLRGSADIHIHNHIAPPSVVYPSPSPPVPLPSVSQRSAPRVTASYDRDASLPWQPTPYAPSRFEYGASLERQRADQAAAGVSRPAVSIQYTTHTPPAPVSALRGEVQRGYAFPPTPYSSSLNNTSRARDTVDLSGLSLERMRELTGHY